MQAHAAPWGRAAAALKPPAAGLPAELAMSLSSLTLDARAGAAGALPFPTARTAAPLSACEGASEHGNGSAGTHPGAFSSMLGAPALAQAHPPALRAHDTERCANAAAGDVALPWCPNPDPGPNPLGPSSRPARLRSGEGYGVSLQHPHADTVLAAQVGPAERGVCSAADVFGALNAAEQAQLAPAQGPIPSVGQPQAPGAHFHQEHAWQEHVRNSGPGGVRVLAGEASGVRALPHGPCVHDGMQRVAEAVAGEGMCGFGPRSGDGARQVDRTPQAAALAGDVLRDHQGAAGTTAEQAEPVSQAAAAAGSPVRERAAAGCPGLRPCPAGAASADVAEGHGFPSSGGGGGSGPCTPPQGTSITGQAMVRRSFKKKSADC